MAEEFKVTHKVITVAGRKLTVWKSTFEAQLKRFTLMENAEKNLNGNGVPQEGENLEALIRRGFTLRTYPSLVACTTGKLFTEDECFRFENDDLELWLATAQQLNPDWFPAPTETKEEVIEDKKKIGLDLYSRLMVLAQQELSTPDNSLPDPESLPIAPDEIDFIYQLWTLWVATEKRYLPSQLIPELLSGHGRILTGLFDVEALYNKVKMQLKGQKPNE